MVVLTSNSTTYHVVNKKLEKKSKFKFSFTVQYIGSESNPPSGTCSDLQVITSKYQRYANYSNRNSSVNSY